MILAPALLVMGVKRSEAPEASWSWPWLVSEAARRVPRPEIVPELVRDCEARSRVPPVSEMRPAFAGKAPVMRSLLLVATRRVAAAELVSGPARVRVPLVGSMVPVVLE